MKQIYIFLLYNDYLRMIYDKDNINYFYIISSINNIFSNVDKDISNKISCNHKKIKNII